MELESRYMPLGHDLTTVPVQGIIARPLGNLGLNPGCDFPFLFCSTRAMYPWTTPPTSWPAPPQPTTPSSTWPQPSQNAHLFGHPSPLHPTWSSSASFVPSASAPTALPFTSLTSTPHAVPGPQLVPINAHTCGSWNHFGTHRSTDFLYSYGTHRSTHMAFCSGFIAYFDYTTDTFAELSIPTSPPSTSTTDWSIDGPSRWTSTTSS